MGVESLNPVFIRKNILNDWKFLLKLTVTEICFRIKFEKFKGEDIDPGVSLKVKEIKKAYDVYDFEKIKEMISVI